MPGESKARPIESKIDNNIKNHRLTIRNLVGPNVIEYEGNSIVALQNTPVIELPEGEHYLEIYKCKSRRRDKKTGEDIYSKGEIVTKVIVLIPEEDTIYI